MSLNFSEPESIRLDHALLSEVISVSQAGQGGEGSGQKLTLMYKVQL